MKCAKSVSAESEASAEVSEVSECSVGSEWGGVGVVGRVKWGAGSEGSVLCAVQK